MTEIQSHPYVLVNSPEILKRLSKMIFADERHECSEECKGKIHLVKGTKDYNDVMYNGISGDLPNRNLFNFGFLEKNEYASLYEEEEIVLVFAMYEKTVFMTNLGRFLYSNNFLKGKYLKKIDITDIVKDEEYTKLKIKFVVDDDERTAEYKIMHSGNNTQLTPLPYYIINLLKIYTKLLSDKENIPRHILLNEFSQCCKDIYSLESCVDFLNEDRGKMLDTIGDREEKIFSLETEIEKLKKELTDKTEEWKKLDEYYKSSYISRLWRS